MHVDRLVVATGLARDHRDVVGGAARGGVGVEILAKAEVLRVRPKDGDVGLPVLDVAERVEAVHGPAVDREPGPRAAVVDVVRGRIRGRRQALGVLRPDAGEIAEVVIEGVILFHNHNDMLNRVGGLGHRCARRARSHYTQYGAGRPNGHHRRINPPQSCASRSELFGVRLYGFGVH